MGQQTTNGVATMEPKASTDWQEAAAHQPLPAGKQVPTSVSAALRKFLDLAAHGQLKDSELDATVTELLLAWAPQPPGDENAPS